MMNIKDQIGKILCEDEPWSKAPGRFVYHGTNIRRWRQVSTHSTELYLATTYAEAQQYADEAYEHSHTHEDPEYKDQTIAPVVVIFKLDDLIKAGLNFQPDWGWPEANEQTTWEESAKAVGSFCVDGFTEAHKQLGQVTAPYPDEFPLAESQLNEMPVRGIEKEIRGYNTDRFKDRDQTYLKTPKYDQIVTKKLERVPFDFYVYIVDTKVTQQEIGLASNSARVFSLYYDPRTNDGYDALLPMIGRRKFMMVWNNPQAVHMMITHNDPDSIRWMPLTPWMILHRMAHAVLDDGQQAHKTFDSVAKVRHAYEVLGLQLSDLENEMYDDAGDKLLKKDMLKMVMPFKSAQTAMPDIYEINLEMFVSYLWHGGVVKFRKTNIPKLDAWSANAKKVLESVYPPVIEDMKGLMWTG